MPRHIFSKQPDVATWTNPTPVGSGPFTRVTRFTSQDYVLSKNLKYWQAGAPKIPCVEYVQASSNDAALLLTQSGQVDWTHNFVPNVETAYTAKDPQHFHSFYATTAYPVSLMLDTTQYPFSLVTVARRSAWRSTGARSRSSVTATRRRPTRSAERHLSADEGRERQALAKQLHPTTAAKALLPQAASLQGSNLIDLKGNPVSFDIHVIRWSDQCLCPDHHEEPHDV